MNLDPTNDFWGGKRSLSLINTGLNRFFVNLVSEIMYFILVIAFEVLVLVISFQGLTQPNGDVNAYLLIFIMAVPLILGCAFLISASNLASLGNGANVKLGFITIGAQAIKTALKTLAFIPLSPLTLIPRYAFAKYIVVDMNVWPLTALSISEKLSESYDQQWKQTLKLEATSAAASLVGLGDVAGAGEDIALAGRYLELKKRLVISSNPRLEN